MESPINVSKSISKKRIVYTLDGIRIFQFIVVNFIAYLVIGVSAFMALIAFVQGAKIFFCLVACFVIWLITNRILVNKLSKFTCSKTELMHMEIEQIIGKRFGAYNLQRYDDGVIILSKPSGIFTGGRIWTIITDDADIYINIQTLMSGGTPSPYYGLKNYMKCRRIIRRLLLVCE